MKKPKSCRRCDGTGIEPDRKSIGTQMKALRKEAKLTLDGVRAKMRPPLSSAYLCDLENCKRNWTPELIAKYKKALA